jgi:uncharacterized protein YprB with RNaseH-like and TPR domain
MAGDRSRNSSSRSLPGGIRQACFLKMVEAVARRSSNECGFDLFLFMSDIARQLLSASNLKAVERICLSGDRQKLEGKFAWVAERLWRETWR